MKQSLGACFNCGHKSHTVRECCKPRDEVTVMASRIEQLMRNKNDGKRVKILSKLLAEQSAHVNFLSEELADQLHTPDATEISDCDFSEGNIESDSDSVPSTGAEDSTPGVMHNNTVMQKDDSDSPQDPFFNLHSSINTKTLDNSIPIHHPGIRKVNFIPTDARQFHVRTKEFFEGACLDIGAQRTCIGLQQANAYCHMQKKPFKLRKSLISFAFSDGVYKSLGSMEIRIPTPDNSFISLDVDFVKPDVPFLLGLDILDQHQLVADNIDNKLRSRALGWSMPIVRHRGHLYIQWNTNCVLFTRAELNRLHKHFWHPSSGKLYNLLKRTNPLDANEETRRTLEEIQHAFRTCTTLSKGPHRFRVTFPKNECIFNHELALDLVWLKSKPVLHEVDTHTHFSAAIFIPSNQLHQLHPSPQILKPLQSQAVTRKRQRLLHLPNHYASWQYAGI